MAGWLEAPPKSFDPDFTWASGGHIASRFHTWYTTVSDILWETFAIYDDPSCGFPCGCVHSPFVQTVAFDSVS